MSAKLILIASYPKSGNTWLRLFFEALRRQTVSINDISDGLYGFQRRLLFDSLAPAFAGELTPGELENWLPDFYALLAEEAEFPIFVKAHDACRRTPAGRWLFPPEHVRAAIHIVRHPFDVAVSYAHHRGVSAAEAVADLCDESHVIAGSFNRLVLPLHERPGSWSTNAASWTTKPPFAVATARYEDLWTRPGAEFARLVEAAGLPATRGDIARAIELTSFERLKVQEAQDGFRERPRSSKSFFRQGRPGMWKEELDDALRARLFRAHAAMMRQFGFADDR